MPFVTIEIPERLVFSLQPFAKDLHTYLSGYLDIPIEKLKTKLMRLSEVYIGSDGHPEHTYAHIKVELMQGRDKSKLIAANNELLARFKAVIEKENPNLHCRITSEFREMDPSLLGAVAI